MRARWYDPASGQFLSVDPAVAITGATYDYAGDNPTDNIDPTGLFQICGPFGIGCVNVNPVAGAEGAVNFAAGFANAATFGVFGISQPFCGAGLNASYDIGELDFGAEALAATAGAGLFGDAGDAGALGNTNPFAGPVDSPVNVVTPGGDVFDLEPGESMTGSSDSKWLQVRDDTGEPTGERLDDGHPSHADPRAQAPHIHVPGITNPDGTPWLPAK